MKKKIVFVIPSLDAGGAEKSLVNLLVTLDYSKYDVDLITFKQNGFFDKLVPEAVSRISLNKEFYTFQLPLVQSLVQFLLQLRIQLFFYRILFALNNGYVKNKGIAEQKNWKYFGKAINVLPKKYDAAIGFLEKSSNYFVVDKIKSKNKIGFIHNDYTQLKLDARFDSLYFQKLDAIVTVSESCLLSLETTFKQFKAKMSFMYNIVSKNLIEKQAREQIEEELINVPLFLTIGRLHEQKGYSIAIKTAVFLKKLNFKFKWCIIGEGALRQELEDSIKQHNLDGVVVLLGKKSNPYPYIKKADLYIQTSLYEGKSIAIDEAKILCKPIIVTDFNTAKDQIEHEVTGIIASFEPQEIAQEIINLTQNKKLQQELINNLSKINLSTESEIEKLYNIIEQ